MTDNNRGQLHELIAIEGELEGAFKRILEETTTTFKKGEHFNGFEKSYVPFADDERVTEATTERKSMDTTVPEKIAYMMTHVVSYFDCFAQKERSNQEARADVIVDNVTILRDIPATALLGLESRLRSIKEVLIHIPTLPPGIEFKKDETIAPNTYRRIHNEEAFKTRKEPKSKILVEPTKEHPAQLEKWNENINVGRYITSSWTGVLSPSEKSEILGRLDRLSRAVKQARQRANCTEVVDIHVGEQIKKYLFGN